MHKIEFYYKMNLVDDDTLKKMNICLFNIITHLLPYLVSRANFLK